MKIIDAHAHIFPDKIAEKAVASIGHFYEMDTMTHRGRTEDLLSSGDAVDRFLVFSTATTAKQVESINRFIYGECEKHPDKLIGLGTMHPEYENFQEEMHWLKSHGIYGIKLHPDFQHFAINDERMMDFYEFLAEEHMFLLTHSGDHRYSFSNPDKVADVAKRFPKLKMIAAHFGGWSEWDKSLHILNLPNVYFDTSSTFPFIGTDIMQKALKQVDPSHLFFGSDFPMWDPKDEIETIKSFNLGEKLTEDILGNNFAAFYRQVKEDAGCR